MTKTTKKARPASNTRPISSEKTPQTKISLSGQTQSSRYERDLSRRQRKKRIVLILTIISVAIIGLGVIFFRNTTNGAGDGQAGQYTFQVGSPGPGEQAPAILLPATDGSTFRLASQEGKTVLLYFQEGLTCQPCWDQLKDIQAHIGQFHALGITSVVSVTTDPLDQLKQKVADEGFSIPVLSDPSLAVSQAYNANDYGMMGNSRDGHTFVLVGPDGRIKWRADYGGAPNYTMYVPVPNLVADIQAGLQKKS